MKWAAFVDVVVLFFINVPAILNLKRGVKSHLIKLDMLCVDENKKRGKNGLS